MRIVFMGSGPFAVPSLRELQRRGEVVAVITQPDRPAGRHRVLTPCAVKKAALEWGLNVRCPERIGDPAEVRALADLKPDLIVVADYGQYLPPEVLRIPRVAGINVHPSLLPRYRGAAPIPWAIVCGETETGVTVLHLAEKMDAGDIILQEKVPIHEDDTTESLRPLLAELGATLLIRAVEMLRRGDAPRIPQDETQATRAPRLKKEDGRVKWHLPAVDLHRRLRAFLPWPGFFTEFPHGDGFMLLHILKARVEPATGKPGVVLEVGGEGPLIACGAGALRLLQVQPASRSAMTGAEFVRGYRLTPGATLR